jgi:hypothetical protein
LKDIAKLYRPRASAGSSKTLSLAEIQLHAPETVKLGLK